MFPNKAFLESLLINDLAQAGTNYSIYFDVMLLLKANSHATAPSVSAI